MKGELNKSTSVGGETGHLETDAWSVSGSVAGVVTVETSGDKLPISTNWDKASVGAELSAGSSETPNVELSNKGNWTGGRNPSKRANGNFEGTTGEGTKSIEGTNGHGCSKLKLREESNRVAPSVLTG